MSNSADSLGGKARSPLRPFRAVGGCLLALVLLSQCTTEPPPARDLVLRSRAHDGELYFDERYLDSISGPTSSFSARTWRELAIRHQLARLEMAGTSSADPEAPDDTLSLQTEVGGPMVKFPNEAANLADIYRRIDSLKVLEHLPITPHPPLKPSTQLPHAR